MLPPEAQALAREAVPGSGEPHVSALASGLLNDTYRVERDRRSFSLRIATAQSTDSILDRAWELQVLEQAAQQGLAPRVVGGDARRGYLVQEWVTGEPWPAASVHEPANIERFAALLRHVHRLPQPVPQRSITPGAWVEHYAAALLSARVGISAALASAAAAQIAKLEALPSPPAVICHSDLHLMNLLQCPQTGDSSALLLLDWEYAHVSEAFWDLAGWSANNDFPGPQRRSLLATYLGREPQEPEWRRCQLLVWLYDYVCLLWSQLYLNSHRGAAADGIAARAAKLNERLQGGFTGYI